VARALPDASIVIVAGDDDQAVYRNLHYAYPEHFLWLSDAIKRGEVKGEVKLLTVSHRVRAPLDLLSNKLISGVATRIPKSWVGRRDSIGLLHIYDFGRAIRDVVSRAEGGVDRVFVIAPTNDIVLETALALLNQGVVPVFLKDIPFKVRQVLDVVLEFALTEPSKRRERYLEYYDRDPRVTAIAWRLFNRVDEKARQSFLTQPSAEEYLRALSRLLGLSVEVDGNGKVVSVKHRLTLASNPGARLIIDTPYTMKGLEADVVYIMNFTRSRTAVVRDEWGLRALYVALTRSRGSVYVVPRPSEDFLEWFPTEALRRMAAEVGALANA
jgi:superfamily I DNA/RNA helicase